MDAFNDEQARRSLGVYILFSVLADETMLELSSCLRG